MVEENYEAGTEILSYNEPVDSIVFIVSGQIDLYTRVKSAKRLSKGSSVATPKSLDG